MSAMRALSAQYPRFGYRRIHVYLERKSLKSKIKTRIGCHSFRATGITEYLRNGGRRGQ